jgi:hypothetical protein
MIIVLDGRILVIARKVHHGEAWVRSFISSSLLRLVVDLRPGLIFGDPWSDIGFSGLFI